MSTEQTVPEGAERDLATLLAENERLRAALRNVQARTYSTDRRCALKYDAVAEICDLVTAALGATLPPLPAPPSKMRMIRRQGGGYIAVSSEDDLIQIGIMGETIDWTREQFRVTRARWVEILTANPASRAKLNGPNAWDKPA